MTTRRLKHLARIAVSNVDKKTASDERSVRLCNYTDVYYNELITADLPFMEATASADQIERFALRAGDVLLTKDSETPDDIAVPAYVIADLPGVVCGYHLALLRPGPEVDGHYLFWALTSRSSREQFSVSANGITRFGLRYDSFGEVLVPLPSLARQRTIADYLDRETTRIDALIEKKRRMIELVEMRFWTALVDAILQLDAPLTPIRRVLTFLTDGPFGSAFTSQDYSEGGAAVVRLGNLGFAEYKPFEQAFIPQSLYWSFQRHRVLPGDLLIAGLGDPSNHPGRACVAPDLGPAIVKGKCFCARVDVRRASTDYLALLLSSPYGAQAVGASGRGSTRTMINLEIIKETPLPLPAVSDQERIVQGANRYRKRTRSLVVVLTDQISRLGERRQALITAAVTGELEVPGVAA